MILNAGNLCLDKRGPRKQLNKIELLKERDKANTLMGHLYFSCNIKRRELPKNHKKAFFYVFLEFFYAKKNVKI